MKVFLQPAAHLSLAMFRVSNALDCTAPAGVEVVKKVDDADLVIMHTIGLDAIDYRRDKQVAVLQYCLNSAGGHLEAWQSLWARAVVTWSYYDLKRFMPEGARFYHAPLGLADIFREPMMQSIPRDFAVFTSGYVTGPGAEAIEECVRAAERVGRRSVHLGPRPVGISPELRFLTTGLIPDDKLRLLYHRSRYVSGLRYVEGFELPALEGLACGARPIMFDRPDARQWFDGHAIFVPETHGKVLEDALTDVLARDPEPVTTEEREHVLACFDWDHLANGFWKHITEGVNA